MARTHARSFSEEVLQHAHACQTWGQEGGAAADGELGGVGVSRCIAGSVGRNDDSGVDLSFLTGSNTDLGLPLVEEEQAPLANGLKVESLPPILETAGG